MERRKFFKMAAAAAAATALPAAAEAAQESAPVPRPKPQPPVSPEEAARVAATPEFKSFDTLSEDYASFCAKPAAQREFFELQNGAFTKVKLDEATWKPSAWGRPPRLPVPGGSLDGVPMEPPIAGLAGDGPYKATWDSLQQYEAPEWYQDAKFGIWAHWSPQCVPEDGDWYARNMYKPDSDQNKNQIGRYGPPSKFGYKDLCAQWTLLNWQPDELISRYKKAGAKLFLALANHHDGFDAWNSKHPWNSVAIGPHRDVVGEWGKAARAQGMRFGVTVHQARNWWWLQTSHDAAKTGSMAGMSYDGRLTMADGQNAWWEGLDPQLLYAPKHPENALPDISYVKNFYDRTRDLIDQHDPDLLYFDNTLFPLGWGGMSIAAYYYNNNLIKRGGKMEGILNVKGVPDNLAKTVVADYERGITSKIMPHVWQSETCIGGWHYDRKSFEKPGEFGGYLPPRDAIHWMVDAVSKNGIFILDIPGKPDGTIDSKEIAVLDGITNWMNANSEAIYSTRPWKVYGEGPNAITAGDFQGKSVTKLGVKDIRFTRNKANTVVYAIVLGWPKEEFQVTSLGTSAATNPGKIANVQLLGTEEKLKWTQSAAGLTVKLPERYTPAADYAAALKIQLT